MVSEIGSLLGESFVVHEYHEVVSSPSTALPLTPHSSSTSLDTVTAFPNATFSPPVSELALTSIPANTPKEIKLKSNKPTTKTEVIFNRFLFSIQSSPQNKFSSLIVRIVYTNQDLNSNI